MIITLQPARDLTEGEARERRAKALEDEAFLIDFSLDKPNSRYRAPSTRSYMRQLAQDKRQQAQTLRSNSPRKDNANG